LSYAFVVVMRAVPLCWQLMYCTSGELAMVNDGWRVTRTRSLAQSVIFLVLTRSWRPWWHESAPRETNSDTDQWWWNPEHKPFAPVPRPAVRRRTNGARAQ